MRVAVVHFHLRRGGVTRVIQTALESLRGEDVEFLVLAGEVGPEFREVVSPDEVQEVPGLGYSEEFDFDQVETLQKELESAARKRWGALPDVWHVHNHCLAKNLNLIGVVHNWAHDGQRLLLQPHDFAEDGRPGNYKLLRAALEAGEQTHLRDLLYPTGANVLYGFLNSRDRNFLIAAGMPAEQTVSLPNALSAKKSLPPYLAERPLYLYPSRCIRRKNIGEMILWSARKGKGTQFGSTLAPENPAARRIYDDWKVFASEKELSVEFEMGERPGVSFDDLLSRAVGIITTSVAEGFGLAFLEPWQVDKPLVGRNIPDITSDFSEAGLELGYLYDRFNVPIDFVGAEAFDSALRASLGSSLESYGVPFTRKMFIEARNALLMNGEIDFGVLDEELQRNVIRRCMEGGCDELKNASLDLPLPEEREANARCVEREFSSGGYGRRLLGYYRQLTDAESMTTEDLDPARVLEQFLDPARFNMLRT
jgi:hypothetical protein